MVNKELLPLLRRYDQRLQQAPTRLALEMRVKRSLQRGARTGWRARPMLFGVLALSAALAALLFFDAPEVNVHKARTNAATSATPSCSLRDAAEKGSQYMGQCNITLDGVTVLTEPGSVVSSLGRVWTVERGRCRFKVAAITPGTEPLRVQVNGGVIEVMGTEFLIDEREQSGSVELYSGKIRFVALGRPTVELLPGEQLSWTRTPESKTMPSSDGPSSDEPLHGAPNRELAEVPARDAPFVSSSVPSVVASELERTAPTAPLSEVNQEVERALRLRSLGQYGEALRALNALLPKPLDGHTREVLSFEKGTILERLASPSSCAHWAEHLSQFPAGRYRSLVEAKRSKCEQ